MKNRKLFYIGFWGQFLTIKNYPQNITSSTDMAQGPEATGYLNYSKGIRPRTQTHVVL